jgi:drug/metabolite transporter (DMT)-like permease
MDLTRKGPGYLAVLISAATWATPGIFIRFKHLKWFAALGCLSLGVFHVLWNLGVTINGVAVSTVQQAVMPIIVAVVALNLGKIHLFRKLRKSPRYDLWPRHGRLLEQTAYRRFLPAERPLHCPSS